MLKLLIFSSILYSLLLCEDCKGLIISLESKTNTLEEEKILKELTEKCPAIHQAWFNLGVLELERQNYSEAKKFFKKAWDLNKTQKYQLAYAISLLQNKDNYLSELWKDLNTENKKKLLEFVSDKDALLLIETHDPQLSCQFAELFLKFKDYPRFKRHASICSDSDIKPILELITLRLDKHEIEPSLLNSIRAHSLSNISTFLLLKLFEILVENEQWDLSELLFNKLSKQIPKENIDFWASGAYVLASLNKKREAESLIFALNCVSAICFELSARALIKLGDFKQAIDLLTKATQHHPKSASLYNLLGVASKTLGDKTQARQYFQTAHSLEPENSIYKENLDAF